jgi:hypothetical protein
MTIGESNCMWVEKRSVKRKELNLGILAALMAVLFLGSLSVSLDAQMDPVSIKVLPSIPKEGQPLLITVKLNNPSLSEKLMSYELYANGQVLMQGKARVAKDSTKEFTYVYPESPKMGERITFSVKAKSGEDVSEKAMSLPAYPPQVWSSFVSFASFSTSLMGSSLGSTMGSSMGSYLTSVQHYEGSFVGSSRLNVGLTFSLVLIVLLVYLELSEPISRKSFRTIGLRLRFSKLSAILFVVFVGMVFTKVVMIIG